MKFRPSTREMKLSLHEFRSMSVADICRKYGWGDWIDRSRDEAAERELERYNPERC